MAVMSLPPRLAIIEGEPLYASDVCKAEWALQKPTGWQASTQACMCVCVICVCMHSTTNLWTSWETANNIWTGCTGISLRNLQHWKVKAAGQQGVSWWVHLMPAVLFILSKLTNCSCYSHKAHNKEKYKKHYMWGKKIIILQFSPSDWRWQQRTAVFSYSLNLFVSSDSGFFKKKKKKD